MISGSQTKTAKRGGNSQTPQHQDTQNKENVKILKLQASKENENEKAQKKPPARRVNWKEDVVDNEHMNKMKSNSKKSLSF